MIRIKQTCLKALNAYTYHLGKPVNHRHLRRFGNTKKERGKLEEMNSLAKFGEAKARF